MTSAQVGKTAIFLNAIGYFIQQDPSPILVVQPSVDPAGEAFSKERLAPMIRDVPELSSLVADPKSRDSGNTILLKQFDGGIIAIIGATVAMNLAARPIRIVLCDEIDKYPATASTAEGKGGAGDPIALAESRLLTYQDRARMLLASTPTIKGYSRIETAYEESDQRKYWVPCKDCDEFQTLRWAGVQWDEGKPETARYVCAHCGSTWNDAERWTAVSKGEWRAGAQFKGIAGFHISRLYSPWARLGNVVADYVRAKNARSAERMQQFYNESLGETWEMVGETVEDDELKKRVEGWTGIPAGVLVRTFGVDVQADRFEIEHVGWGAHEESWSLDYKVIFGDPEGHAIWKDLERYIADKKPHAVCIDSGGANTQAVYAWANGKMRRRIYAIKGMAGPGRPVWPPQATKLKKGGRLFMVGVDAAKDSIYSRLKLDSPGPGYCHFPVGRDADYFEGLTSESAQTTVGKSGYPVRAWKKKSRHARNEPLDCRVYAYAAVCSMSINWDRMKARFERRSVEKAQETPQEAPEKISLVKPPPKPARIPGRNWTTNW